MSSRGVIDPKEADDDIESEFKSQFIEKSLNITKEAPMFLRSTCCGQVLLLSLKDLVPVLEDDIGLKCDEAYLEDSAIRFLKDSFMKKKCVCAPYKFIFVDLDDPTINLQRFMVTVTQLCNEKDRKIPVYGCGLHEARGKKICASSGVTYMQKPVSGAALRSNLPYDS
jgi:hypothetical protein